MKKILFLILALITIKVSAQNSVEAGSVLQTSHQIYLKNPLDTVNRRFYVYYPNGTADRMVRWPELLRSISSSALTFNNGTTKTGNNIAWGGALTGNTSITGTTQSLTFQFLDASSLGLSQFSKNNTAFVSVNSSFKGGAIGISPDSTLLKYSHDIHTYSSIRLTDNAITVKDLIHSNWIKYAADYSTNGMLDTLSIPSWGAVRKGLIQNQNAIVQPNSNLWISGTGKFGDPADGQGYSIVNESNFYKQDGAGNFMSLNHNQLAFNDIGNGTQMVLGFAGNVASISAPTFIFPNKAQAALAPSDPNDLVRLQDLDDYALKTFVDSLNAAIYANAHTYNGISTYTKGIVVSNSLGGYAINATGNITTTGSIEATSGSISGRFDLNGGGYLTVPQAEGSTFALGGPGGNGFQFQNTDLVNGHQWLYRFSPATGDWTTTNSFLGLSYRTLTTRDLVSGGGTITTKDSSLQVNKNLFDLANKATARTNLGVSAAGDTTGFGQYYLRLKGAPQTVNQQPTFNNGTTIGVANIPAIVTPPAYIPVAGNLISNPSFETIGSPHWANWNETGAGGIWADETVIVHSGTHASKLTASNTFVDPKVYTQNISVSPSTTYYFSFWTRGDGRNAGMYMIRDVTNAAPIIDYTTTSIPEASYRQVVGSFTTPAGCVNVYLMFTTTILPPFTSYPPIAWFDDAVISATSITPDPSSPVPAVLQNTYPSSFTQGLTPVSKFWGGIDLGGVSSPATPTVATGAAGSLTGTYHYVVTYLTLNGESAMSSASAVVSPSSQRINLTNLPVSTSPTVIARNIFREKTGVSGTYYFVTQISDNTTTAYTDNTTDANLGYDNHYLSSSLASGSAIYINGTRIFKDFGVGMAIGQNAGAAMTRWDNNLIIGDFAGDQITTADYTTILGPQAGRGIKTQTDNTFIGGKSGFNTGGTGSVASADHNTFIGSRSGFSNLGGYSNVFVGYFAGETGTPANANKEGNNNTFIGTNTGASSTTQRSFMTVIGSGALGNCSNCVILGRSADNISVPGSATITNVTPASTFQTPIGAITDSVVVKNAATGKLSAVKTLGVSQIDTANIATHTYTARYATINGSPTFVTQAALNNSTSASTTAYADRPRLDNQLSKSANYTVLTTDWAAGKNSTLDLEVDATAGNMVITLPSAASIQGYTIFVTKIDVGVNTVTINTVSGGSTLLTQWQSRMFKSNGTTISNR